MLLHNVELKDNEFVETDDVKMYNLHCEELDLFELPLLGKELDKDLFDTQRQREWYIPKHYKELDIVDYVAKLCPSDKIKQERVAEELYEYQARNLLDMLRCLVYIIDTMRKHNIVWGVGRGRRTNNRACRRKYWYSWHAFFLRWLGSWRLRG